MTLNTVVVVVVVVVVRYLVRCCMVRPQCSTTVYPSSKELSSTQNETAAGLRAR